MRNLYLSCLALLCFVLNARAQFSGNYGPAKFTLTQTPGANGLVNTSGAPASITITGSDDPSNTSNVQMDVDYTVKVTKSGIVSFNWSYHTNDSYNDPQWDLAGVLVNGVFTQLTNNTGGIDQSNSYSVSLTAGDFIGFRVRAIDNIYGTATFTISSFVAPGITLPVKLSQFTGRPNGNAIQLQWTAATEINAGYYEVQRSANGSNFTSIGRVNAGAIGGQYQFTDASPLPGLNHYRLRMVDNDNSFEYSGIVVLTTGKGAIQSKLFLYPNPAYNAIGLTIQSQAESREVIQLFNAAGTMISSESLSLPAGSLNKQLNITSLAPGTYFIRLATSGITLPFVKK